MIEKILLLVLGIPVFLALLFILVMSILGGLQDLFGKEDIQRKYWRPL